MTHIEKMVGSYDTSATFTWRADDINSYDVVFESENALLHSDETQLAAIRAGIELGLFAGEDGKIPRSVRKKLLCRMHIGDFVRTLYEDELQNAAARRENMHLMKGESLPVGICDDHELHLAAHRRAALDYAYDKLRRRDPAAARALEAHIAAHTEKLNLAKEKQNA